MHFSNVLKDNAQEEANVGKILLSEVPEGLIPRDDAAPVHSDRGTVAYRCKVYKALLDITSESDCNPRPLVLRSGRRLVTRHEAD